MRPRYHALNVHDAQKVVDALAEVRFSASLVGRLQKTCSKPFPEAPRAIASAYRNDTSASVSSRAAGMERGIGQKVFHSSMKLLRGIHKKRQIEFDEGAGTIQILPPGAKAIQDTLRKKKISAI